MCHPDKVGNTPKSHEISAKTNDAFATSFDDAKRLKHDTDVPISKIRMHAKMDPSDTDNHSDQELCHSHKDAFDDDGTEASEQAEALYQQKKKK